jgi:hypothetical protein
MLTVVQAHKALPPGGNRGIMVAKSLRQSGAHIRGKT